MGSKRNQGAAVKIQEAAGKLVGISEQSTDRLVKQAEGTTQNNCGNAENIIKDSAKK